LELLNVLLRPSPFWRLLGEEQEVYMNAEAANPTPSSPASSSKRLIFQAALVGALLPRPVSLVDDKGIRLPGEDWPHTIGWLLVVIVIALAAGWVAANVWKEQDTPRAFALGLSSLYVVTGGELTSKRWRRVSHQVLLAAKN